MVIAVCAALLLTGCGGKEVSENKVASFVETETPAPEKEEANDLKSAIENYEFEIEGTYKGLFDSEDAISTVNFLVKAKDVEILADVNGSVTVEAELDSDFYILEGRKTIYYTYQKVDRKIEILSAGLEVEQDLTVKPIVELSTDCFYAWEPEVTYCDKWEKIEYISSMEVGVDPHTVNVTKENFPEIQFDFDGTWGGRRSAEGRDPARQSNFEYLGDIIFTIPSGESYVKGYEITYKPSLDKPKEKWWELRRLASDNELTHIKKDKEE